jgi:hypothetical protein
LCQYKFISIRDYIMEPEPLRMFEIYAISKGYKASVIDDTVRIIDVTNPGNNFSIKKADGYYLVSTTSVSKADYEYTAKCMIYLLMAEFNKDNSAEHLHLKFKVDL